MSSAKWRSFYPGEDELPVRGTKQNMSTFVIITIPTDGLVQGGAGMSAGTLINMFVFHYVFCDKHWQSFQDFISFTHGAYRKTPICFMV